MQHIAILPILVLIGTALPAADGVTATVKEMEFTFQRSALGQASRGGSVDGTGYYPIRDPQTRRPVWQREQRTVDIVVLDNGLVEAWVAPALGGRLLRAIDKRTGTDYFFRNLDTDGTWIFDDHLAWNPAGVKASFPFFEHGLALDAPAGWRTVQRPDGALTIAMDLRFTANRTPGDIDRYGRYGDETLTTMVTLRPGSTVVEWTQRKDNNNATPRSDRFWNDAGFPVPVVTKTVTARDPKSGQEVVKQVPDTDAVDRVFAFLYPCRWVVDHGPSTVHTSPHWSSPTNWNVSHFAIDAPFRFAGAWYAGEDLNRLRINDPRPGRGPGVKLWNAPGRPMFELWGGEGWVFEYPGELKPAHQPTGFSHQFWIARGIGRAAIANETVAAGVDGTAFKLTASRDGQAVVADASGAVVAAGPVGPYTVLAGTFDGKRLMVKLDQVAVLDQTFPLDRPVPAKETPVEPAAQAMFEKLKAGFDPGADAFYERQTYGRNQGQPGIVNAMEQFAKHTTAGPQTASLARVAYRLGELAQAERLARLAGGPEGDLVLGLLAVEAGGDSDFGTAGWEADYLRALGARKAGDTAKAIALARAYIDRVPDAWYPRLALAAWTGDAAMARRLADENPASPEAQLVLQMLGQPDELDLTLRGRGDAAEHLAVFRAQIEQGVYRPLTRFPLDILRAKGW